MNDQPVLHAGPVPAEEVELSPPQPVAVQPATQPAPPPPAPVTASATMLAGTAQVYRVKDPRGRNIGWKRLGPLERMMMYRIMGPEDSKNDAILMMAVPAFMTTDIDGVPMPPMVNSPTAKLSLDARITLLGDDGLAAVDANILEVFGQADPNATGQDIKN